MATTPAADLFNIAAAAATPRRIAPAASTASDKNSFPAQLHAAPANSENKPVADASAQEKQHGSNEDSPTSSNTAASNTASSNAAPQDSQETTNSSTAQPTPSAENNNEPEPQRSESSEDPALVNPTEPPVADKDKKDKPAGESLPDVIPYVEPSVAAVPAADAATPSDADNPDQAAEAFPVQEKAKAVLGAAATEGGNAPSNSGITIDGVVGGEVATPPAEAGNGAKNESTTPIVKETPQAAVDEAATKTAAAAPNVAKAVATPVDQNAEKRNNDAASDTEAEAASVEKASQNARTPTSAANDTPKRHSRTRRGGNGPSVAVAADKISDPAANPETTAAQAQNIAIASLNATPELAGGASDVLSRERPADAAPVTSATETVTAATAPNRADGVASRASQALLGVSYRTDSNQLNQADQSRFVQRVSNALRAANQRQDAEIRLRLSPPELGALKLQVKVEHGALIATLEAETHAARDLLIKQLPVLRERLAEQEIRIETFDVQVNDRQANADQGNHTQQHNSQGSNTQRQKASTDREPERTTAEPSSVRRNDGQLDIIV